MRRISSIKLIAGVALFAFSASAATYWFSQSQPAAAFSGGAFCPDMANEQAYKDKRVQTYATLIPGKDGWIFRTKNDFRTNWKIGGPALEGLLALQSAMRTHNAELVIVMPPVRGMIHTNELLDGDRKKYGMENPQLSWDAYERFISDMKSAGIRIVGINRNEVNDQFYYKRNHHWTSRGHAQRRRKSRLRPSACRNMALLRKLHILPSRKTQGTTKALTSAPFKRYAAHP